MGYDMGGNAMTIIVAKPHGVFFSFFVFLVFFCFKEKERDPLTVSGTHTNRYNISSIGNTDDNNIYTKNKKEGTTITHTSYINIPIGWLKL